MVYMYYSFSHASVNGHLGCFLVLAIVNSAAVNTGVHVSFSIMVFSEYMPRSRTVGSYLIFIPSFFKESPYCSPKKVKLKLLSHVQLFVTTRTIAYQAPPSMGFSRQEYWSGLPFPSPGDLPDLGIVPASPAFVGRHFTI